MDRLLYTSALRDAQAVMHVSEFRAHLHPPPSRLLAAALVAVSRTGPLALLALLLAGSDPPMTTAILVRLVIVFVVAPALAARLVAWVRRVELEIAEGNVVATRPGLRLEIPRDAIASARTWRLPLPGPGVSLRMCSGRRYGLQLADPQPFLVALARAGVGGAHTATRDPGVAWAHARATGPAWRWHHYLGKFPLFALFPTAVLFNAHQHIAFGGLWGEWYLVGPGAWLGTFAIYWTTVTIYVALYAGVWRGVAESITLVAAAIAPSRAVRVRSAAEVACRWLYYLGVPVLLLIRFLPW